MDKYKSLVIRKQLNISHVIQERAQEIILNDDLESKGIDRHVTKSQDELYLMLPYSNKEYVVFTTDLGFKTYFLHDNTRIVKTKPNFI